MRKTILGLFLVFFLLPYTAFSGETIHPFAYGHGNSTGILFGAWSDGQWISAVDAQPHLNEGDQYHVYDVEGFHQNATADSIRCDKFIWDERLNFYDDTSQEKTEPPERDWKEICKGYAGAIQVPLTPVFPKQRRWIAVSCPWNPMPRPVSSSSTDQADYIEITRFVLESKGLHNPDVQLLQVLHVDLDGDGAEETLVSAFHSRTGTMWIDGFAGDYGVVYMLARGDGKDNLTILAGKVLTVDRKQSPPVLFSILGVLDLNGDGAMEVVLRLSAYETSLVRVLELNGSELETVYKYRYDAYAF